MSDRARFGFENRLKTHVNVLRLESRPASRPRTSPNLGVAPRSTHGGPYRIQQRITVEGLVEERDRARLQGSPARLLVAVRSQDDDTNAGVSERQLPQEVEAAHPGHLDRKSTRLNSSHGYISYAVFCLKKKNKGSNKALEDIHTISHAHT